jgi:hypothetical protein
MTGLVCHPGFIVLRGSLRLFSHESLEGMSYVTRQQSNIFINDSVTCQACRKVSRSRERPCRP